VLAYFLLAPIPSPKLYKLELLTTLSWEENCDRAQFVIIASYNMLDTYHFITKEHALFLTCFATMNMLPKDNAV